MQTPAGHTNTQPTCVSVAGGGAVLLANVHGAVAGVCADIPPDCMLLPMLQPSMPTFSNLAIDCIQGLESCTSPATSSRVGDTSLGVGGEADSADRNTPRRAPMLLLSTGGMEE